MTDKNNIYKFLQHKHGNDPVYENEFSVLGHIQLYPMDLDKDIQTIYQWMQMDYARYWGAQNKSLKEVKEEYHAIISSQHSMTFIGKVNGKVSFLFECYDPDKDQVGEHYKVEKGDMGMHILVGPPEQRIKNFTWDVFHTVMSFMLNDPEIKRVIVEPDVNNEKIHVLNKRAGFEYQRKIKLTHKTAYLAFCTQKQFYDAMKNEKRLPPANRNNNHNAESAVQHLSKENWNKANRLHLCKAISEFTHERILTPELCFEEDKWKHYKLSPKENQGIEYWFRAQVLSLNHWYIDQATIRKIENGESGILDSVLFIQEFKKELNIDDIQLPEYMEEITNTLYGAAYMLSKNNPKSEDLVHSDYQTIEHSMTGGHPCFVANNGRIGFDTEDYRHFAPETGNSTQLIWLAGHTSRAAYNAIDSLPYDQLIKQELGEETINRFKEILYEKGLEVNEYYFIPVHPWQWYNKLAMIFAPDIANNYLVCLGYGDDEYRAQQSIRTFYNVSNPEKFYTKTALSVLNMGFVRGLTPYYMDSTPPITTWIKEVIGEDAYIKKQGFELLCEVATVGYLNHNYEQFGRSSAYNKMLAALWRESPTKILQKGQQLITMASLLHTDQHGTAFLPQLIKASGKDTESWLKQYFRCYFKPLLHCFFEYDLVFMPHGENLILILEDHVPVKAIMKDITEEIVVFKDDDPTIPGKAKRICVQVPEELKILSIFTDIFDCFFRFINQVLVQHCNYSDERFWELVAECVHTYQSENPHLSAKFKRYDLFAPEFTLSCLNRLQLRNHKQMLDLADPVGSLQFAGNLKNPIAPYRNDNRLITSEEVVEGGGSKTVL